MYKQYEKNGNKVVITRSKNVNGYDYYLTVLTFLFGRWVISSNFRQTKSITSSKEAVILANDFLNA